MDKFLQTLLDALSVGSLYALIALGYTMVYGILKFINFAHSDVFVLGAWVSLSAAIAAGWAAPAGWVAEGNQAGVALWVICLAVALTALSGLSFAFERFVQPSLGAELSRRVPRVELSRIVAIMAVWAWSIIGLVQIARFFHSAGQTVAAGGVLLLVAMLACGLVGFTIERLAYKPLRRAPRLNVLITAIGVSLLLQNLGQLNWMFGTRPQSMPSLLPNSEPLASIGNVKIWLVDVVSAGTAVILMVLLDRLVFHTKLGRAMRAVAFNTNNAALMGIPVDRVISFTFVLGAMLAAAAGFLYSQKYSGLGQSASAAWVLLGLKAFVAAVVGGIGNIRGAMLGGLLIGLLEFFGAAYVSPELRDVYVFGLLILVLLFRPSGLLGSTVREKV